MKLKQINEAYPTIAKLAEISMTKLGLNYQDGKKLTVFCKQFKEEYQLYAKRHSELLEACGFEATGNGMYQLKDEDPVTREKAMKEYSRQKAELEDNDVELECDIAIKGGALLDFSANDNLILECFFDIKDEE